MLKTLCMIKLIVRAILYNHAQKNPIYLSGPPWMFLDCKLKKVWFVFVGGQHPHSWPSSAIAQVFNKSLLPK